MTNICRCGTYARVRKAIHALAAQASTGGSDERDQRPKLSRARSFMVSTAPPAAACALGFHLPLGGTRAARAATAGTEVNAWIVIHPDDRVVDPHRPLRDGAGHPDRRSPSSSPKSSTATGAK